MAGIEDKLAVFSNVVLAEAEKQKEKLVKESEMKKKKAIENKENEYLEDAYAEIQRAVSKYSKESNERVLKFEMGLKKNLLLRREEIIDEVFKAVEDKLSAFTQTDEYKIWLEKKIEKACKEVGRGKKNVFVSEKDLKYKADLESKIDMIDVAKCDDEDIIGGATVYNVDRKVFADYTLKQLLDEQRHLFLQTSGLTIN